MHWTDIAGLRTLSGMPAPALLIVGQVARSDAETISQTFGSSFRTAVRTNNISRDDKGERSVSEGNEKKSPPTETFPDFSRHLGGGDRAGRGAAGASRRAEAHPVVTEQLVIENRGDDMADSIALPRLRPISPRFTCSNCFPASRCWPRSDMRANCSSKPSRRYAKAHHLVIPNIEYVLWAILIGLVISNTVTIPEVFLPGIATYEFWLKAGIVLLGARFLLGDVVKLGAISLVLVALELGLSIALMTWLGRLFKLKPKLTSLLAIGSSICGVSAIIAAQGAIDADDEDSSFAIAAILALGAIALFTFPLIGHALGMSDHAYGMWAGLAVDNTAEATAAGALVLRCRGQDRRAGQDHAQRHDRLCGAGIRDLLGQRRAGQGRSPTRLRSCGRSFPSSCSASC